MFNYACLFHVRQLHKSRSHKYICQNVKQFPTHVANVILHPPGVMSVQREGRGLNVLGRCSREPLLTCFTRNITLTHFLKGSRWTWKHDGSGEMYSDSYVDLIEPPLITSSYSEWGVKGRFISGPKTKIELCSQLLNQCQIVWGWSLK